MAISLVYSNSNATGDGGSVTINLTGAAENDIVIVVGGHPRVANNAGVSVPADFNELFDTTTTVRFSASWKRMGATPDTSVTCIGSGNAADACAYAVAIFRGVSQVTAIDATSTTASGTGQPNSPSITTVTNGAAVISAFLQNARGFTGDAPTDYTILQLNEWDDTNDASVGIAWKTIATAGAENPIPWNLAATGSFQAASIALRPASGTVSDAAASATGTGTATFTATSTSAQPFSMTGTGTATFIDGSFTTAPAVFAATGTGTAAFTAAVTQTAVAAMTGTGTASLVGASNANSLGSMTGTITPAFRGGSLNNIVGAMTGTGTASFVNGSQSVGGGALGATGTGTAAFAAKPFDSRPFSMTGTNTTSFVGVPLATQGPFTMTGTGTALFVGTLQGQGNLAATATVTVGFGGGSISSRAFSLNGVTGTVNFVGARDRLSHIRETIESRGAVSVSIN